MGPLFLTCFFSVNVVCDGVTVRYSEPRYFQFLPQGFVVSFYCAELQVRLCVASFLLWSELVTHSLLYGSQIAVIGWVEAEFLEVTRVMLGVFCCDTQLKLVSDANLGEC